MSTPSIIPKSIKNIKELLLLAINNDMTTEKSKLLVDYIDLISKEKFPYTLSLDSQYIKNIRPASKPSSRYMFLNNYLIFDQIKALSKDVLSTIRTEFEKMLGLVKKLNHANQDEMNSIKDLIDTIFLEDTQSLNKPNYNFNKMLKKFFREFYDDYLALLTILEQETDCELIKHYAQGYNIPSIYNLLFLILEEKKKMAAILIHLLGKHHNNKPIADELYVAVNTRLAPCKSVSSKVIPIKSAPIRLIPANFKPLKYVSPDEYLSINSLGFIVNLYLRFT